MSTSKRSAAADPETRDAAATRAPGSTPNPWARFGWIMASIWLIFLFYPISSIIRSQSGLAWQVTAWVGLAVFVAVYLYSFRVGTEKDISGRSGVEPRQYVLLGIMLLGIASTTPAIGFDATGFFPFLVSAVAYQFTRPLYWVISVLCVGIVLTGVLTRQDGLDYIALLGILSILVGVNALTTWLIARSIDADQLSIELATSEEREAVARDVHDLIGHSLTVVKLKAQLARRLIEADPERARAELEEIERITGEAIQGVRATVTGLRSDGLAAQLDSARASLGTAGIELAVDGEATALSPAQALPAGWILREAVTNILRHSGASEVSVRLRPGELQIRDNGGAAGAAGSQGPTAGGPVGAAGTDGAGLVAVGAEPAAVGARRQAKAPVPGNGLRGMAERASASGGRCTVRPGESGGMIVEVTW